MDQFFEKLKKPSCLHKQKRQSLRDKNITSLEDKFLSKVCTSPVKSTRKMASQQLLAQNQKLKRENYILQEYFETFEQKYKQQKKQNEKLKRQLNEYQKCKGVRSPDKKSEVTYCLSERTLINKISRTNKSIRTEQPPHL